MTPQERPLVPLVGERGPEIVTLPKGTCIILNPKGKGSK